MASGSPLYNDDVKEINHRGRGGRSVKDMTEIDWEMND